MATTAIWDVTDRLDRVIDYAANPEKTGNPDFSSPDFQCLRKVLDYTQQDVKTEKQFYVTGINCDPATSCGQMGRTISEAGRHPGLSRLPSLRAGRGHPRNRPRHRREAGQRTLGRPL